MTHLSLVYSEKENGKRTWCSLEERISHCVINEIVVTKFDRYRISSAITADKIKISEKFVMRKVKK